MQLEIYNLTKYYGDKCALDDFTITFKPGVYGILGPNGAGKSTLLNLLTDNVKREKGQILFDGTDILKLGRTYRMQIGYMPQQQGYYGQFTARRFLHYMAEIKGLDHHTAKAEIESILDIIGLKNEAHRKIGGYSGGMRQRVLLGQALIGNPKILILDEPTAGLDPRERIRIRNFIAEIAVDKIVLLATHVVSDIECIANQVLLMRAGKILDIASPAALIEAIEGKVGEITCSPSEMQHMQEKYGMGNITQQKEGLVLRLVGDSLPEGSKIVTKGISLEDVYLYHMNP